MARAQKKIGEVLDIIKGKDKKPEEKEDVIKQGKKVIHTAHIERGGRAYIQYTLEDMSLLEELIG